ncbi:hypothetical protein [Sulfurirhabdus autotrophica]|uniref:Uncharacterized protein n=1 Tax=Sulfurirhabdus autotrophica TaxID=1706046 RepID=A0A4R3YDB4_9PROT|nr:hypothetical protein [Sulfurirhabdus autotrophica]TCV90087.1 hypothetical protein EDC63_10152 [Sulfurirhabdus autotrophica]
MAMLNIYRYEMYDIETDHNSVRSLRATREAIERFGGTIIEESCEEVDSSLLDDNGCFRDETLEYGGKYNG